MKIMTIFTISFLTVVQTWAVCPAGTEASKQLIQGKSVCFVGQEQTQENEKATYFLNTNLVLTPEHSWVLRGDVRIGGDKKDNSTLTIEAGTVIYGQPKSFLTITRDSKIFVNGSQSNPVVFTGIQPDRGYWGGLVIAGNAQINNCTNPGPKGCESFIEGADPKIAPMYGGNNDDDSSGSIRFMRVEYAGYTFGKDSELNAITFYGVGRGTVVENIQAYKGADDGIELFGGAVNLKYVVSTDNDDDGFDWDQGWRGAAQYVFITLENAQEADPNGIEADNLKKPQDASPRSNPILSNVTIVTKGSNPAILNGLQLRRGTGAQIYNTIVSGSFQNCLNIDDEETFKVGGAISGTNVQQTGLVMQNTILQCAKNQILEEAGDLWSINKWFGEVDRNNFVMAASNKILDDVMPMDGSAALDTGMTPPEQTLPGNFVFDSVDYVGAFSPVENDWTEGWTVK